LRVLVAGATETVATAKFETVSAALPILPSTVALMVDVPALSAFTTPWSDTVATFVLELVHVAVRPVRATPFASRGVTVSGVL
jgi:hypothetical protein